GDRHVDLSDGGLPAPTRLRPKGFDADIDGREFGRVPAAAVDHDPRPAIRGSVFRDDVAEQCRDERGPAIDNQDLAVARRREEVAKEDVVLEAADCSDL